MYDNYTPTQIKQAVNERRAVIRYHHGDWQNIGTLHIYDDAEIAAIEAERDTRGHCYSMSDETWSYLCTDYSTALRANRGLLIQR